MSDTVANIKSFEETLKSSITDHLQERAKFLSEHGIKYEPPVIPCLSDLKVDPTLAFESEKTYLDYLQEVRRFIEEQKLRAYSLVVVSYVTLKSKKLKTFVEVRPDYAKQFKHFNLFQLIEILRNLTTELESFE